MSHSCFCSLDKLKSKIGLRNLKTTKYTVHAVCHNSSDVRDAFAAIGSSLADLFPNDEEVFCTPCLGTHWTQHRVFLLSGFLLVLSGLQDSWPSPSAGRINRGDDGRRETQTRGVFTLNCTNLHQGDTQTHRKFLVFLLTIIDVDKFVSSSVQRIKICPMQRDKLQNWMISSVLPHPQVEDK